MHRHPTNFPGLQGKDLTPLGTIELYTDPQADSDGDGMLDIWEVNNSLNPALAADATRDRDGDGVDNRHEYVADTDPNNAASFLAMLGASVDHDGVRIVWQGGTSVRQYLESRTNLICGESWTAVYTNEPDTPVTNTVTIAPGPATRFYRIRTER